MPETKEKNVKKERVSRTRNYACIVYPESAPENWKEILSDQFIPSLISPLHDKDLNPTGEPKKPHYHVILMFDSVKTTEQAKNIFDMIGGVGCQVVNSIRGYARYLCHLDNPDKAQYNEGDIVSLCGADYSGVANLAIDKYKAVGEMMDFCITNEIYSFAKLLTYSRANRFDWFRLLCDNSSYVMREFLESLKWTVEHMGKDCMVEDICKID